GAGDQGMMFGYATAETPELMPLPIHLAHRLAEGLAADRRSGISWLRPDGKTQVTVAYRDGEPVALRTVLVSAQHRPEIRKKQVEEYVRDELVPRVLGDWYRDGIEMIVNPS